MAKKVKNKVQASSRVSNPNQPTKQSETLIFDFSYKKWLQGVRTQGFTNMLKDDAQFAQYIVHIFQKLIPIVQDNWKDIKKQHGNFRHCHTFLIHLQTFQKWDYLIFTDRYQRESTARVCFTQ